MVEANLGTEACRVQASPHVAWVPDSGTEALTHVGYGFCLLASKRLPRLKFWSRFCDANFVSFVHLGAVELLGPIQWLRPYLSDFAVSPSQVEAMVLADITNAVGDPSCKRCRWLHTHMHIYITICNMFHIYIYIYINDMGVTLHVPSDVDPVVPYKLGLIQYGVNITCHSYFWNPYALLASFVLSGWFSLHCHRPGKGAAVAA